MNLRLLSGSRRSVDRRGIASVPAVCRPRPIGRGAAAPCPTGVPVAAAVIPDISRKTLQGFVRSHTAPGAFLYTDTLASYEGLPNHTAVNRSIGQYVEGSAHTNGVESFWSLLKRAHLGTYHQFSRKHLHRYVNEFTCQHNIRGLDAKDQIALVMLALEGKRLRYKELVG